MLPSVKISVLFCPFHNTVKCCSLITTASVVVFGVSVEVVKFWLSVVNEPLSVFQKSVVVLGVSIDVVKTWLSVVNEPLNVFQE